MFVKNDLNFEKRYYNGKIGFVSFVSANEIEVFLPEDGIKIEVEKYEWQNVRYTLNPQTKEIEEEVLRSEEHTSELQSRPHLVCRLLLEKKKKYTTAGHIETLLENRTQAYDISPAVAHDLVSHGIPPPTQLGITDMSNGVIHVITNLLES